MFCWVVLVVEILWQLTLSLYGCLLGSLVQSKVCTSILVAILPFQAILVLKRVCRQLWG